uniref:Cadherin domain-containing protein n=1 Tax=Leptobrachium leishanense TaxID=445787 RepID=A0A8C5MEH8_9ANUR
MYRIKQVVERNSVLVSLNMLIIVRDCNDNAPVFLSTPYNPEIPENTQKGSIIFTVTAVDYDNGGLVTPTYHIDSVIPNNDDSMYLFSVFQQNGSIALNGTLNYNTLSTFYQLTVRAMDRGGLLHGENIQHNTTSFVSLNIEDIPDTDPQFINAPYTVSIYENAILNTEILKVSAVDGDKGINDEILFSISQESTPGLFILNVTGHLYVAGEIDREELEAQGEQVVLDIMAKERNPDFKGEEAVSFTTVTIRILDENDNKPNFYNCDIDDYYVGLPPSSSFFGEIEENSARRVPVSDLIITVNDPDKDQNGVFSLTLRGTHAQVFSVSPSQIRNTAQVQILVNNSTALDYEMIKSMEIEIVANDTGNLHDCCSFANVSISLIDVNDNIPSFENQTYYLAVDENCDDGTSITKIIARDADSGDFGTVTYSLLPESIGEYFHVGPSTGVITVVDGSLLDRERRSLYYATLQARDGGNAMGTTLLEITIRDVNDEIPTAIGTYNIYVNENTDDVSIQIEAYDNDEENTNNSHIEYYILPSEYSDNFTMNVATGLLTSLAPLNREAIDPSLNGRIVLTLNLTDLGVPLLFSEVNVTINVEDLNDNEPLFTSHGYNFSVNESSEGAFVGSLFASDHDQTELNNRVSFRISQGGSGNFIIRAQKEDLGLYRGDLFVDPEVELDYERLNRYTLIIEAQDNGLNGVSHAASTTVTVHVLDLNDESPYVNPSLMDLSLPENGTGIPELLADLEATDPDTDHELEFQKLSVECFKNNIDVGNICHSWLWLAPNGSLYGNNTSEVDYELCDLMVMLFRVEDKKTLIGDRYSRNVTQRVVILDVNDNIPEFAAIDETFVVVADVAPFDYQVATVKASDKDSGLNAEIEFSIASVIFIYSSGGTMTLSNIFNVYTIRDTNYFTGSVRVATALDGALKGQYQVTVTAKDKGQPPLESTRSLNIFTVDESFRVSLIFSSSPEEVRASSDSILSILTVSTRATVYLSDIKESSTNINTRADPETIMYLYFVYSNGTAITPQELDAILRNDAQALSLLLDLGLKVIGGSGQLGEVKRDEIMYGVIAGLAGALLLIMVIFITALLCMRKSHKRKIRAMKASKTAMTLPAEAAQGPEVIPGTNMFTGERANPMLNVDITDILDQGFAENSSLSDSISVDSLYDHIRSQGGTSVIQENPDVPDGVKDVFELEEALAVALSDRVKQKSDNKALSTTDL